jgi:hypothetical protein
LDEALVHAAGGYHLEVIEFLWDFVPSQETRQKVLTQIDIVNILLMLVVIYITMKELLKNAQFK